MSHFSLNQFLNQFGKFKGTKSNQKINLQAGYLCDQSAKIVAYVAKGSREMSLLKKLLNSIKYLSLSKEHLPKTVLKYSN